MGWGRGSGRAHRARRGRAVGAISALLITSSGLLVPPAARPALAAATQTLTVPAGDPHGVDSAALDAFATYRVRAAGRFLYGGIGEADAECSTSNVSALNPVAPWLRQRYPFIFAEDPALLVASDFWDPDPSDDPADVYVDHRNVEWIPALPSPTGCNESDHTYETLLTPVESRPVNFAVFDIAYGDNFGAVTITIEQVSPPPPLPRNLGRHTETVLVSTTDPAGANTATLTSGRDYLFIAHGTWIYDTSNFSWVADTECARSVTDPQYLRHRFGDDPLDVLSNGQPIEWHGLGPESHVPGAQGCNAPTHLYWVIGPGRGVPVRLSVSDSNYADNAGTLSIDVFELD